VGDAKLYDGTIDDQCPMVLPHEPFIVTGEQAKDTVSGTPRWTKVALFEPFDAYCTTVYRMIDHGTWRVVQHQPMVPLLPGAPA
jgi:hypothetical protein